MLKFLYFPISSFNLSSQFLWGRRLKFYPEKLSYNICSSLSVAKLTELINMHTSNDKLQVHQLSLKRNASSLYPQPIFIYHMVTTYCLFLQFSMQAFFPPAWTEDKPYRNLYNKIGFFCLSYLYEKRKLFTRAICKQQNHHLNRETFVWERTPENSDNNQKFFTSSLCLEWISPTATWGNKKTIFLFIKEI